VHAFNQSRPSNCITLLSMTCGPHMPYLSSPSLTFTHLQVGPTSLFSLFLSFLLSRSQATQRQRQLCCFSHASPPVRSTAAASPASRLPPRPIASMSYYLPQRRSFFTGEASLRQAFLLFPQPPLIVTVSYSRLFLREIKRRSKSSIPRHYSSGALSSINLAEPDLPLHSPFSPFLLSHPVFGVRAMRRRWPLLCVHERQCLTDDRAPLPSNTVAGARRRPNRSSPSSPESVETRRSSYSLSASASRSFLYRRTLPLVYVHPYA
jgi:hypothetical protein